MPNESELKKLASFWLDCEFLKKYQKLGEKYLSEIKGLTEVPVPERVINIKR